MTYAEQLKTKQWKEVRDRILRRDKYTCQRCRSNENLQVHHIHYIQFRMAWEYEDNNLVTLCRLCHAETHGKADPNDLIARSFAYIRRALEGWHGLMAAEIERKSREKEVGNG